LTHLESSRKADLPEFGPVYDDISQRYARRLATLSNGKDDSEEMTAKQMGRYRSLLGELLHEERKTAIRFRNEGRISDEVLRKIEHELDLSETRLELS
jgi:monovalent cation/hydrogen antiporter